MSDTQAADGGAISVDQATDLLGAIRQPEDDQTYTDDRDASASFDDDEAPFDEPVIAAPAGWDEEAQGRFARLPREDQEYLAARETERAEAVSAARQEAAWAREEAQAELGQTAQLADQLEGLLPELLETFDSRWGGEPDWEAVVDEYGAEQAFRLKAQYEREAAQVAAFAEQQAHAQTLAHHAFVAVETQKLKSLVPELADPKEGPGRARALSDWLLGQGASPAQLQGIGALETSVAWKAMQWDRAQAGLRVQGGPRGSPSPNLRPAAGQTSSSHQRTVRALDQQLSKSGRLEDAMALLAARRARKA